MPGDRSVVDHREPVLVEVVEDVADWAMDRAQLVRFVAKKR